MTRLRNALYLSLAMVLAGTIMVTVFAPRARAAQEGLDEYETPRTFQLWVCSGTTSCKPVGKPLNSTACQLDLASLANASPKGTRLACHRVKQ
jgi:hypothetical protein